MTCSCYRCQVGGQPDAVALLDDIRRLALGARQDLEDYASRRILVDAAFAAAVEEDGFVTAYPPVGK